MSIENKIHNKPPYKWSTITSTNGIIKNMHIHPASHDLPRITEQKNLITLVREATKHIPNSKKIIDQHFSQKEYSAFKHVNQNRAKFDHVQPGIGF